MDIKPIFIVGGTRTGSTIFYQMMAKYFDVWYISNYINDWNHEDPLQGLEKESGYTDIKGGIELKNDYGKTDNIFDVSEGSNLMKRWFGGGHPSQDTSSKVIPEMEREIKDFFLRIRQYHDCDLVVKNAWNNFRVKELKRLFPKARFIWLKRDIRDVALSDYLARERLGKPNEIWNSATPSNYKEIQKLHPYKQVILQQYEYYKALEESHDDYLEIWYEDFCENMYNIMWTLSEYLNLGFFNPRRPKIKYSTKRIYYKKIFKKINKIVKELKLEKYEYKQG